MAQKMFTEMLQQKLNKTERYKKLRTDTIKKSRADINKKIVELKLKDLITKQEHSILKASMPKTQKTRPIFKIYKNSLKMCLTINTQNFPLYKIEQNIERNKAFSKK